MHLKEWVQIPVAGREGQEWAQPDRNRTETGQNLLKPARIRPDSGQNVTMLNVYPNNSKECKGAIFSRFSTCKPLPLDESTYIIRGIKAPRKREKKAFGRQRFRTKSQFRSLWGFDRRPSGLGKSAPIHFTEFSSCMASISRGIRRVVLGPLRLVFAIQVVR